MRLARISMPGSEQPRLAAVVGDTAVPLESVDTSGDPLLGLLRGGAGLESVAPQVTACLDRGDVVPLDSVALLAPLQRPGKIVAIGLNYADHTKETGLEPPAAPLTFAKYPTSVTGPGATVTVPTGLTAQLDWEVELAVVIGRECGPAARGTLRHLAGYTVANDLSARDLQFGDGQWTRGKSLDGFCPLGPTLVTADEILDPQGLRIWAKVNGEIMQDASTGDMIFDIAALLDFVTAGVTLEPGDVLLTGTPPGVGAFRDPPVFLQDGDAVTVGVETIGELTNIIAFA